MGCRKLRAFAEHDPRAFPAKKTRPGLTSISRELVALATPCCPVCCSFAWRSPYKERSARLVSEALRGLPKMELNGARSNPRAAVELSRIGALHDELLRRASVDPREPRPAPAKVSPVLETVTLVLEQAGDPMQVREIHAAAEQLAGKPLLCKSVKAALAVNADGEEARFERVRRGYYRIAAHGVRLPA